MPETAWRAASGEDPQPPVGWQAPLLDLLSAVLRRWQIFLIVLSAGLAVGIGRYLISRPFFQSTCVAVLMPREKPVIDLELTNGSFETGRDIAARGDTGALMLPARVELYTQLLRSDAVLTSVGARFAPRLGLDEDVRAVELVYAVRDLMKVSGTEEGMITIEATGPDPQAAADLANALVAEMIDASKSAERHLLQAQSSYLDGALAHARVDLARKEGDLEAFVAKHGIVDLTKQTHDVLTLMRETEFVRQGLVQQRLERLQAFSEKDHVAQSLQKRIDELDADLVRLRKRAFGGDGTEESAGVQEIELRLSALREDVKRARDLVATLESQLAIFRIREEQPAGSVSILKPAIPVKQRAGPSKSKTIGTSILIAFVLGVVLALLREQFEKVGRDPYLALRAEEIRVHAKMLAPKWLARRISEKRSARGAAAGNVPGRHSRRGTLVSSATRGPDGDSGGGAR